MDADDNAVRRRPVPPRTHCPPSRRGHAWQELPIVSPSQGGATIRQLYDLRRCARCKVLGRVDSQGCIRVVEGL